MYTTDSLDFFTSPLANPAKDGSNMTSKKSSFNRVAWGWANPNQFWHPYVRPTVLPTRFDAMSWSTFHVLRDYYINQLRLNLEGLVICKLYGFHPFFFSVSIIPSSFICKQMGQKLHASHVGRRPFGPPKKTRLVDLHQRFYIFYTSIGSMKSRRKNLIPIRCFSTGSLLGGSWWLETVV